MEKCDRCVKNERMWYLQGELTSSIARCETCGLWYVKPHLDAFIREAAYQLHEQSGQDILGNDEFVVAQLIDDLRQDALEFQAGQETRARKRGDIYYEDRLVPDLRERWKSKFATPILGDHGRRCAFTLVLLVLIAVFLFLCAGCRTPVVYGQTTWDKVPPGTKVICWGRSWQGGDVFVQYPDGSRWVIKIDNEGGYGPRYLAPDYRQRTETAPNEFTNSVFNPVWCLDHAGLGTHCTRCWRKL